MSIIGKEERNCLKLNKSATEDNIGPGSYPSPSIIGRNNKTLKFSNKSGSKINKRFDEEEPLKDIRKFVHRNNNKAYEIGESSQHDFVVGFSEIGRINGKTRITPEKCNSIQTPRPDNSFISKVERYSFCKKETDFVPGPGYYNQKNQWSSRDSNKHKKSSVPDLRVKKGYSCKYPESHIKDNLDSVLLLPDASGLLTFKTNTSTEVLKNDSFDSSYHNLAKSFQNNKKPNFHTSSVAKNLPSLKYTLKGEADALPKKYYPVFENEFIKAKAVRRSLQNLLPIQSPKKKSTLEVIKKDQRVKSLAERKELKDAPGPGHYDIKFDVQVRKAKPEQFQFFGSNSKRFPSIKRNHETSNISPGMYDDEIHEEMYYKLQKDNKIKKKVPFGASENRFFGLKSLSVDYSPGNFTDLTISKKFKTNEGKKNSFGTTQRRFPEKLKCSDIGDNLGPGSYNSKFDSSFR
ncbi:unnamed protein product [Moneuplotes crassus]|uniref:Uncharacterized protein n=1 Tax=Euplotes crassus TaxID=5936 RepID=A0AAD1UHI8_EUPCR|nr:unnamed protein product [Moneuplotes crassus]